VAVRRRALHASNWTTVVLLAHTAILLILFVISRNYAEFGFAAGELLYPFCWLFLGLTVWSIWSWNLVTHSLFDPYVIFLSAAVAFNGGQALLEIFHLNRNGLLEGEFDRPLLEMTVIYVTVGIAAFHWGALASAAYVLRRRDRTASPRRELDFSSRSACRLVGWALLAIAAGPVVLQAKQSISVAMSGGYQSLYVQSYGVGVNAIPMILSSFLVPGVILLLVGANGNRTTVLVSVSVMLLYIAIQFFLGYRSGAAWPLAAYAWAYHRTVKRIPLWAVLFTSLFLLFVVFPVIGQSRIKSGEQRYGASAIVATWQGLDNPIVTSLSEIGGSMKTVAYTFQLVPSYRDYDRGGSYIYSIFTIVPNVGMELHPARARGTPSVWLVQTVAPFTADRGGGFGYSFIAEGYLNFGWTGGLVALLVIGALFGRIFAPAIASSSSLTIFAASSFLAFLTVFARGESSIIVRPLIWYTFGPILLVYLLTQLASMPRHADRHFMRRHHARTAAALSSSGGPAT
jgi:oligosaccharide repeat unit polymerase